MTANPYMPGEKTGFVLAYILLSMLFLVNAQAPSVLSIGGAGTPFLLMGIYYWSVYRPTLVPLWLVFVLGLLLDLLSGSPVGLNTAVFVATRWLVTDQRLFLMGQSFMIVWLGFVFVCGIAVSSQWIIYGALKMLWSASETIPATIALGAVLFPPVSVFLHATHQLLPSGSGRYKPQR